MNPQPPTFSIAEIRKLAGELYGLNAAVGALPSYYDQNFQLDDAATGRRLVLKVAHAGETRSSLDLQNRVMEHVARAGLAFGVPGVVTTLDGHDTAAVNGHGGSRHWVRLLTWVEGTPWIYKAVPSPELLQSLGRSVGEFNRALEGFTHPAMDRVFDWDPRQFLGLRDHLSELTDPERRKTVERILDRFESFVAPRLPSLRTSVIHCDVNCHNVLVGDGGELTGLIDFGDVIRTATVSEVAITTAYAMFGCPDPLAAAVDVLRGYDSVFALGAAELEVVLDIALSRLALSVTSAARNRRLDPRNTYATECEAPGWEVIDQLVDREPETVRRDLGLDRAV